MNGPRSTLGMFLAEPLGILGHMGRFNRVAALLAAVTIASGCRTTGDGDPLGDIDGARDWANRSSAVGVWSRIDDIVAAGDMRDPFRDPECPVIAADGSTVTVTGGCTANDARMWFGSATIVHSGTDDRDVTIDGFGNAEDPGLLATLSGSASIRALADGRHEFDLDLVNDAPFEGVMNIAYLGDVEGGYTGATVWNGTGAINLGGDTVSASTVDEVWDRNACGGAPASGETTLTSGAHVVTITYDGAIDCDEAQNAAWSLDGVDRGAIDGISCAVSARGAPPSLAFFALALAAATLLRRRTRGSRPTRTERSRSRPRAPAAATEP